MKLKLLLFTTLISFNLFAQTLTPTQELVVRNLIAKHFNEEIANSTSLNQGANAFAIIDNDTLFSLQGYHYIFKLKGDTLERLDRSFFHGGNFERYLYIYDGKIHLMGGYGLFNTNNNIEVFDSKTHEWSVIKTTGEKPEFIRGICLRTGDFIYSFYNSKSGNNVEDNTYDPYIYRLDLKQNVWKRFENVNYKAASIFDKIYTTDYCIGIMQNTALVINKNTAEYISLPREVLRISLRELFNYSVNNNTLSFQNYLSTYSNTIAYKIDIDSIWKKYDKQAQLFVLEAAWYQIPKIIWTCLSILTLIILTLILFYTKRNKSINTIKNVTTDTVNPIAKKIQSSPRTTLDIDELDALLEINHMEFDSRKLKRHRLLSDLEKTNPGLITRQKDETDKRRFIYVIQKSEPK